LESVISATGEVLITDPSLADMTKALLALHVIAAILAVGPVAVAASMFPAALRAGDAARIGLLHRICRVYAVLGVAVPVFGFATAASLHVLGTPWLLASIGLTGVAALVLGAVVLPAQDRALLALAPASGSVPTAPIAAPVTVATTADTAAPAFDRTSVARLAMCTGLFNLLWATVTVLMILRPGSTTGV
jgi:hypothetical protein